MFGTIICNRKELTEEENARYQSTYCGMCRAIKTRYGQVERLTVNYDMTFLAILLNGLYEENEIRTNIRCPIHLLKKEEIFSNKYIDYAADMTILLSYYKCKDDWADERKHISKSFGKFLEKDMKKIEEKYPRQTACVRNSIDKLSELEKANTTIPDAAVNWSGKMLSELFVYEEDYWSQSLRKFGYEIGRFIYLMDAVLDYEKDKKERTYNPLFSMKKKPDEVEAILVQAIAGAAAEFERLPIIQDAGIIRNILYGGVWQTYNAKITREGKKNGEGSV